MWPNDDSPIVAVSMRLNIIQWVDNEDDTCTSIFFPILWLPHEIIWYCDALLVAGIQHSSLLILVVWSQRDFGAPDWQFTARFSEEHHSATRLHLHEGLQLDMDCRMWMNQWVNTCVYGAGVSPKFVGLRRPYLLGSDSYVQHYTQNWGVSSHGHLW